MADFSRLPGPNADLWDWQLRGLCRGKDSSLFFHPEGERGAARSGREVAAKEICLNCPVQIPCVEHALRVREPYGVWGGMTEDEREEYYAKQKILARAQAARVKAAKAAQARLKEQLLREKAAQSGSPVAASANPAAASASTPTPTSTSSSVPAPATAASAPLYQGGMAGPGDMVPAQPAQAQAQAQEQPSQGQPVRAAGRSAGDLAGTVAAVRRARKTAAEPAKKAAPKKTAPKSATAKTAPKKSAAAAKAAPKHLAKV